MKNGSCTGCARAMGRADFIRLKPLFETVAYTRARGLLVLKQTLSPGTIRPGRGLDIGLFP